ncbi:MAG: hypothetical protein SGCHY_005320 [Lobulomycetales sp.]
MATLRICTRSIVLARSALPVLEQADAAKKHKGWFGGNKLDEASELYAQAATGFKLQKNLQAAAAAYVCQADCCLRLGEKDEASSAYQSASKALKKIDPAKAADTLAQAILLLTERGRFQTAANNEKQLAEICEMELEDYPRAVQAYETAAEWYRGEDSNAQANACLLKAATLASQHTQAYDTAIAQFESVAQASLDNNLTKWSVREYLLKAGLCILCTGDLVRAHQAFDERYPSWDVSFSGTREYKLLQDLLAMLESSDVEGFTSVIVDFDKMTKLDNWKTALLLRVKKSIVNEEMDFT